MQFTSTQKSAAAWALIAAVLSGVFWLLAPVLAPFVVAAVLAYALTPVVDRLDNLGRGRMPRLLAVVVIEILFLLALAGVALLMVPILAKELPLMRDQLPALMDAVNAAIKPWLKQWGVHVSLDGASLKAFAVKYLSTNVEDAVGSVLAARVIPLKKALVVIPAGIVMPAFFSSSCSFF